MVLFNSESTIAGKTHSEILAMKSWTRYRWYKTISLKEKEAAMAIVEDARRTKISVAYTPERRKVQSEVLTKYWKDPENKIKVTGENNPMKRPENRAKIRAANIERWADPENISKQSEASTKRWADPENTSKHKEIMNNPDIIAKISAAAKLRVGEKNPNWRGGISTFPYGPEFNAKLKRQIRERDNHTCQECHQTEEQLGYALCVHHIDYNKLNSNPDNLISLCRSCHSQTNYGREDWTEYFGRITEARL